VIVMKDEFAWSFGEGLENRTPCNQSLSKAARPG
jgi:hypothetical protein